MISLLLSQVNCLSEKETKFCIKLVFHFACHLNHCGLRFIFGLIFFQFEACPLAVFKTFELHFFLSYLHSSSFFFHSSSLCFSPFPLCSLILSSSSLFHSLLLSTTSLLFSSASPPLLLSSARLFPTVIYKPAHVSVGFVCNIRSRSSVLPETGLPPGGNDPAVLVEGDSGYSRTASPGTNGIGDLG